jgi:hypothetical protein
VRNFGSLPVHGPPQGEEPACYRVWSAVNRPLATEMEDARRLFFSVGSPKEGCAVIRHLQARREEDPAVVTSEFGLEVLSVDGWSEWHDRHGRDVMGHFRLLLVGTQ